MATGTSDAEVSRCVEPLGGWRPVVHPLGGLGYANFADELACQEEERGVFFDTVVTATCTGSTQAGMVVGFLAQDRPRKLIGIDTAADPAMTRAAVFKNFPCDRQSR